MDTRGKKRSSDNQSLPQTKRRKLSAAASKVHQPPVAKASRARTAKPSELKAKKSSPAEIAAKAKEHDTRPAPTLQPPAWANTRPELCEALPWFFIREGFAHTQNSRLLGLLLDTEDGFGAEMTSEVVITTVGGGRATLENGKKGQAKDQVETHSKYVAFKAALEDKTPIPCIVGNRNAQVPIALQTKYAVLGYFHCTHLWDEKSNGYVCSKVRLQKVDLANRSWWASPTEPDPPSVRDYSKQARYNTCPSCDMTCPQVYQKAWICLNRKCADFWAVDHNADLSSFTYDPDFRDCHTEFTGPSPQHQLVPELPHPDAEPDYKQGIVCPKCRKCSARRDWEGWRCDNEKGCDFVLSISRKTISAADAAKASDEKATLTKKTKKPATSMTVTAKKASTAVQPKAKARPSDEGVEESARLEDQVDEKIVRTDKSEIDGRTLFTYTIPGIDGISFCHCLTTPEFNKSSGGPDELFAGMQEAKIGLRRHVMSNAQVPGTLTAHYSKNFGLPYAYVVPTDSAGFRDAPQPVLDTLSHLTSLGQQVVPDGEFLNFNEMLVVGYFEGSHMGFHDDGEETLGPTVTSLTLGNACWMTWRMKRKYYTGFTNADCTNYDPNIIVLPGCNDEAKRKDFNARAIAEGMSKKDFNKEAALLFNPRKKKKIDAPWILRMRLEHGDEMLMHGAIMQTYFEHEVEFVDGMRFGLTCRHIKPEMLDEDQLWKGEFPEGVITENKC